MVLVVLAAPSAATAGTVTETFGYTGAAQTWTVPAGVTSATFDVYGAAGGAHSVSAPARGGRATATIAVTPGDEIEVYVGGQGRDVSEGLGTGGFNGGNTTGPMTGGGASDVRIGGSTLGHRAIVAGGGGGGGSDCTSTGSPDGGGGGGLVGGAGTATAICVVLTGAVPGSGGTQSQGGANAADAAAAGSLGAGGPGVNGGGGGGGGFYGGAGGSNSGGGGGGSGFGPAGTVFETGTRSGDGLVEISYREWTVSISTTGAGTGTVTGGGLDCGGAGHTTCDVTVPDGTPVTLTASPAPGSAFDGWSGAGCTGTGACTVVMTQARSVQAEFRRLTLVPVVTALSPRSGPAGTTVTITGANLGSAREVLFGTLPAAFFVDGHQQITAVAPEGQGGTTDVLVVAEGGTSQPTSASAFTYHQRASTPSDGVPVARRVICGRVPTLVGRTTRRARAILARDGCAAIRVQRLGEPRRRGARIVRQSVAAGTPVFEGDPRTVFVRLG